MAGDSTVCWRIATLMLAVAAFHGCVSMQLAGKDGRPKLIGAGKAEETAVLGGTIYRIWSPGLSLCFHPYSSGFVLGNQNLRLFFPDRPAGDHRPPVGFWQRVDGIEVGPRRLMAGHYEKLVVALPEDGASQVQWLEFDAKHPEKTLVAERRMYEDDMWVQYGVLADGDNGLPDSRGVQRSEPHGTAH